MNFPFPTRILGVSWLAFILCAPPVCGTSVSPQPAFATPPPAAPPSPEELSELGSRTALLAARIRELAMRHTESELADIAIFERAAAYVLAHPDQFHRRDYFSNAMELVGEGFRRADSLAEGAAPWIETRGGFVSHGYVSAVDGSVQPYCMWIPAGYDPSRPMRLDVILHGRSRVLNEVSFLASARDGGILRTETGRRDDPAHLKLYVFGRGNLSYRWAGESDVFEALESVRSRYNVDPERIVLRGFSMGGTGAWHLGLHHPDKWAAVEAGAGFVETRPEVLATIQEPWRFASLAIHDASNSAANMPATAFVGYAGELDPQFAQMRIIQRNLRDAGVDIEAQPRVRFLIGKDTGHNFRPDQKAESDSFIDASLPRKRPARPAFVTYTPAYGRFWDFQVDSLDRLYEKAELSGTWDAITTRNIWVLRLASLRTISIDGQQLEGAEFHRVDGAWRPGLPSSLRKRAGLQGPIDDAFQQPFLCVRPATGNDPVLETFRDDFARYFHGSVRIKSPDEVTAEDVADFNLVLFGDPTTNPWIAKVLPGLPLEWTEESIRIGGLRFPSADNTVAMIHPNPLNPDRYVVLNSGHTFPGDAAEDMHWFMHPRLGDYAVLDRETREVQTAGFFNKHWLAGEESERVAGTPSGR